MTLSRVPLDLVILSELLFRPLLLLPTPTDQQEAVILLIFCQDISSLISGDQKLISTENHQELPLK